ncbi:uncharacterized protein [Drosophila virilis]|uniref:uncharacterized protein n=1 Tax=Drosophila virilis TaxID=7244 RepID=UPI0038B33AB3
MKSTQLNLNHCKAAQALLTQSIRERNTDVAIICEPYKPIAGSGWVASKCGKAAIWSLKSPVQEVRAANDGFLRAKINGITVYSCYAPPSRELRQFQTMQEEISEYARDRAPLVIAGDFNAWAVEWGSKETIARGTILLEECAALDLGLANDGQELTYCKAGRGSIIDPTLLSSSLYRLTTWKVSNEFTVHFEMHGRGRRKQQPKTTGRKWEDNNLDEETYTESLRHAQWTWATELANDIARQLMGNISEEEHLATGGMSKSAT